MTISEAQKELIAILTKAGVDSPGLCAFMLLEHVTGLKRLELRLAPEKLLSKDELNLLWHLTKRRVRHEPMAYIIGQKGFYEHSFLVSPATLIPRPETELIVELALELLPRDEIFFVDAGCGCGNIGLSLLAARKKWQGLLLDQSVAALQISVQNATHIAPTAFFAQGNLSSLPCKDQSLDLIVSNPPYIGIQEQEELTPEVLAFEPHIALFSDAEGYGHLMALAKEAKRCLKEGGYLIVEHGAKQQQKLKRIFEREAFSQLDAYNDLASLPRCIVAKK